MSVNRLRFDANSQQTNMTQEILLQMRHEGQLRAARLPRCMPLNLSNAKLKQFSFPKYF